ncbi:MAG: aminoglycoside phosphotransferase family protein [Myxococcota bacterium]
MDEETLDGGNLNQVVRVGDTVRRATGVWTPAVHALLEHLRDCGFHECPRVIGIDDEGREILSYLPGKTVGSRKPWPEWTRSERTLTDVARWLGRYHRAVADFVQPEDTRWRLTEARAAPGEIICHNDVAPYNVAWGQMGMVGVFDWDVAGPGTRELDLAFAAWNFVPLHAEAQCGELGWLTPVDRASRLRRFVGAYGLEDRRGFVELIAVRMQSSIDRIQGAADRGDPAFRALVDAGHLEPVRASKERLMRDATVLQRAIE